MKLVKLFIILAVFTAVLTAQTAYEIVNKAENAIKGEKTARGIMEMTIVTPDYERSLRMEGWFDGTERSLIVIQSPPKEAGNKTLKIENEMWNYLKNTETTIKIPPSMMLQSWNGSDFTNDDLARESNLAEDYDQKIIKEEEVSGAMCWKIEMQPKENAAVVWGKLYYWIRKSDYLPALIEYYDEKGELIRYMEFAAIEKVDDRRIPTEWIMNSVVEEGHKTTLKIVEMDFNVKLRERIFSFRELERGN